LAAFFPSVVGEELLLCYFEAANRKFCGLQTWHFCRFLTWVLMFPCQ